MKSTNSQENIKLYILLVIACLALLYFYLPIGVLGILITACFLIIDLTKHREPQNAADMAISRISQDMVRLNREQLYAMPVPVATIGADGAIRWYNRAFRRLFEQPEGETKALYGLSLDEAFELDFDAVQKEGTLVWRERDYNVKLEAFDDGSETLSFLQLFDVTIQHQQRDLYNAKEPVFCYLLLDNYDDIFEQLPAQERSQVLSRVDVKINEWADSVGAFIVAYDSDRYLMIFEKEKLAVIEESHFHILDEIRELGTCEKVQMTMSIGIGVSDNYLSIREADELSHATLDIALARGGDQAVVREDERMTFYGGATEAAEKRTKVKARVKAHGLQELIREADNVLIMGHKTPDMDCIGAAIGLIGACRGLDTEARIVFKEINYSIRELFKYLMENGDYENVFITPKEAEGYLKNNTLLVVVDTQNVDYMEFPQLIDTVEKVVVIDHHRRSGKFIERTVLSYTEVYASSTCELIAELLQYFENKDIVGETEANALMAGMCMDTKMFTFKTGVRTFEAASYLRRRGADTIIAKTLLQDDLATYSMRSAAVSNAKICFDSIAISTLEDYSEYAKIIAAQAADELLNIRGIAASFVILKTDEGLIISGRSMGDINVQLILEKIGGGGHLAIAGAQLPDIQDLEEGRHLLMDAIETYMKERE